MKRPNLAIGFITDGEAFHGASPEERALGGSETALVQAARALAQRGHRVQVFCRCPKPGIYNAVRYRDRKDLVRAAGEERFDALVVSRFFAALDLPLQAGLKVLWNHDVLDKPRELAQRLEGLDLALVLSRFQAQGYAERLPACADKLAITRNGLDLELIAEAIRGVERRPDLVTYVSRPERGLKLLLEKIWPRLREARPRLRLAVCGYQVADTALHPALQREYADMERLLKESPNVEVLGGLAKKAYYRHLASCALLLYPCVFPEISCIAALEAQALGTPVLTSRAFALPETVRAPEFLVAGRPGSAEYVESYIKMSLGLLGDPQIAMRIAGEARARVWQEHDWALIAAEWEELFLERLRQRLSDSKPATAVSLILAGDRQSAARLLDEPLAAMEEGPAPPDPAEEGLLDEIAKLTSPALDRAGGQGRVGVLARDGGRSAAGLGQRLPEAAVEELAGPGTGKAQGLAALVIRDILERQADPAEFLGRALSACVPDGLLVLCVASGAWPLVSPGYLGRLHDLGRDELMRLLPGRRMLLAFAPRGLVGRGVHRYHAGRWLAVAPVQGPAPGPLDPEAAWRRARPAPDYLIEEARRVGLI